MIAEASDFPRTFPNMSKRSFSPTLISSSVADAYFKVGLVIEAGGIVVTVDEGKLDML